MKFWKMSGAGNDFVLVEKMADAKKLCDRKNGIGADGLLVVNRKTRRLRYFNADGSAAFCGNGTRCAALWLWEMGARGELELSVDFGRLRARKAGARLVAVSMPRPDLVKDLLTLKAAGKSWDVQLWDAGVPHAVIPVRGLERFPVVETGRPMRSHKAFGKPGANVNFIERRGMAVAVRTYERGVEDETLACGSGAMAAASAAATLGWGSWPFTILTRGGDELRVFQSDRLFWLEGPAKIVFTGEL